MSQKELEQGDQEVMAMVNVHSHPDAEAAAEKIVGVATTPAQNGSDRDCAHDAEAENAPRLFAEKMFRKRKRMEILQVVLFVAACLCTAAALVAAWYVPDLLIWVVNAGVLVCGIAGAVKIDKYIRWWR